MSQMRTLLMRMFGRPRGRLGALGGRIMARTNAEYGARVVELLKVRPDERVLEVGFGPGVVVEYLAKRASRGSIAGIDQSPEMVGQARARNRKAIEDGRVDLRQGVVDRLPFAEGSFDKAVAINSMQVWPDATAGLREMRRVMRPGATIVLGFTPYSGQSKNELTHTLVAAGFTNARLVEETDKGFSVLATKP
jgi:ubiquinone/menaquinone biosynthesis C-methylase UbiE